MEGEFTDKVQQMIYDMNMRSFLYSQKSEMDRIMNRVLEISKHELKIKVIHVKGIINNVSEDGDFKRLKKMYKKAKKYHKKGHEIAITY
jgi:hypothetical protein